MIEKIKQYNIGKNRIMPNGFYMVDRNGKSYIVCVSNNKSWIGIVGTGKIWIEYSEIIQKALSHFMSVGCDVYRVVGKIDSLPNRGSRAE
jgi:hypothetical protein